MEPDEVVPDTPPSARASVFVAEDGTAREHYDLGYLEVDSEEGAVICQLIPVSLAEGKIVVAVPSPVWNRTVQRRYLPKSALSKAILVEVAAVEVGDLESITGTSVKVWLGLLDPGLENAVVMEAECEEPGIQTFVDENNELRYPTSESLAVAAARTLWICHGNQWTGSGPTKTKEEGEAGCGEPSAEVGVNFGRHSRHVAEHPADQPGSTRRSCGGSRCVHCAASACRIRSRGGECSQECRSDRGAASQTGKLDVEAKQDGGSISRGGESAPEVGAIRVRGRRRGSRGACWRGLSWNQADREGRVAVDQADDEHGKAIEEERRARRNPRKGRCWWQRRRRRIGYKLHGEVESRSLPETERSTSNSSKLDLSSNRRSNGGRLQCSEKPTGLQCGDDDIEGLGRTQVPNRSLPIDYSVCMASCRSARCIEKPGVRSSESTLLLSPRGSGSIFHGPRELVFGPGIPVGTSTAIWGIQQQTASGPFRTSINSIGGRAVPRGDDVAVEGPRPLPREQEEAEFRRRQAKSRSRVRRRAPKDSGSKKEGEAEAPPEARRGASCGGGSVKRGEAGDRGAVRVPGARASTVHGGIWHTCFSVTLRLRTGMSSLLHKILQAGAFKKKAQKGNVWPMPLPYPEALCKRKQKALPRLQEKLAINYLVLVLNWLAMGEKLVDVSHIGLGTALSSKQWEVVRRLAPLVQAWVDHAEVDSASMGRSAAKMETVEDAIAALEEALIQPARELRSYMGKTTSGPQ